MTDLQKLVEQWAKEVGVSCDAHGLQFTSVPGPKMPDEGAPGVWECVVSRPANMTDLVAFAKLAMLYAAEEAAKTLMEMHAGAKGQHNYYHFAANKIRERFKAL